MSQRDKLIFEDVFKITTRCMWVCGSHPALPRGWLIRSIITLLIATCCFGLLFNSIIFYRIPAADYDDAVREAIMLIVAFTIVCKYTIIVRNRHIILNIIRYIDEHLGSDLVSETERKIISKTVNNGIFICKFWLYSAGASGTLFPLKAFCYTIYNFSKGQVKYVQIFDVRLPNFFENQKDELLGYIVLSCALVIFAVCAVTTYVGYDPLISIVLVHFCGQLEILSLHMSNVYKDFQNPNEILSKIKEINKKLMTIYQLVNDVQNIFLTFFEFTMKTTTFLLPFIVYQIVQDLRNKTLNVEYLSLLTSTVLQFYVPCYYSNLLMEKSKELRQAIYFCEWEKHANTQVNKMLIFMLTRTSNPVVLNTIFYLLNLETYAEMCRQSYAIYSIMNAVWT